MTLIKFKEQIPNTTCDYNLYNYHKEDNFEASFLSLKLFDAKNNVIGTARYDLKSEIISKETSQIFINYNVVRHIHHSSYDIYIYSSGFKHCIITPDKKLEVLKKNEIIQNISVGSQNITNAKLSTEIDSDSSKMIYTILL
jgi:hypothetical protein